MDLVVRLAGSYGRRCAIGIILPKALVEAALELRQVTCWGCIVAQWLMPFGTRPSACDRSTTLYRSSGCGLRHHILPSPHMIDPSEPLGPFSLGVSLGPLDCFLHSAALLRLSGEQTFGPQSLQRYFYPPCALHASFVRSLHQPAVDFHLFFPCISHSFVINSLLNLRS